MCIWVCVLLYSTKSFEPNTCLFCFFLVLILPTPQPYLCLGSRSLSKIPSVCVLFKTLAWGNSKGLRCQNHRYCLYLEQTVLQPQRAARSTVLSFRAELGGGGERGNLSFFLSFLKANAVQNHFTVGLGLFIQNCQFPYLNVGWGFFPSYSSLSEGDSCFYYVSLFKKGVWGGNSISDSSRINQNVWARSKFQRSGCRGALAMRILQVTR